MIDIHAHLDDEAYEGNRHETITNLSSHGIELVINASCNLTTMTDGYNLANKYDNVYCTVGLHPHDADKWDNNFASLMTEYATNPKVVAVGEIGLDYYYDFVPRNIQRDVFAEQIELADKLALPLQLHIRDAYGDTTDILHAQTQYLNNGIIWHCYSGSAELARQFAKEGHYFSFGGAVTFKNANKQEVIDNIPITQVLTETDCPYMTPVPYRGKTNYPQHVSLVLNKLAELYHTTPLQLEQTIANNCRQVMRRIK